MSETRISGLEDRMQQIESILANSNPECVDSKMANENEDLRVKLATTEARLADTERELEAIKKELTRRDYRVHILSKNLEATLKVCDDNKIEVPLL